MIDVIGAPDIAAADGTEVRIAGECVDIINVDGAMCAINCEGITGRCRVCASQAHNVACRDGYGEITLNG